MTGRLTPNAIAGTLTIRNGSAAGGPIQTFASQEKIMTKLTLLGAAVIVAISTLAVPATAQHRVTPAVNPYTEGDWCPGREPGNPYARQEDYIAWSGWRARGGWDDRNDFNCPQYRLHRYGAMR
jgi:hypothetical protein